MTWGERERELVTYNARLESQLKDVYHTTDLVNSHAL